MNIKNSTTKELEMQIKFMTAKLRQERKSLKDEPLVIDYDNGGGQKGTRKNPHFEAYENLMSAYTKTIKQYISQADVQQSKITSLDEMRNKLKVVK